MTLLSLTSVSAIAQEKPGINLNYMDKNVKPGDDFFRYVNGAWYDKTEIPADKTRWGSFDELRFNTDKDVLAILKEAVSKNLEAKSDQGKAVNVYKTYMDTITRNKRGIKPLQPYLAKINAIRNVQDLNKLITELTPEGGIGFYSAGIGPDAKDSNKNVVYISLGSLGLPDRDYYISDDKDSKEKREKYVLHVTRMLQFLGEKPELAKQNAEKILALEIEMARPRLDRVQRRDRRNTYNPMSVADLQKLTPSVNWDAYLQGIGLGKIEQVIVSQPKYMEALETIFKANKIEDWKAYLRWILLDESSNELTTEIEKANWDFYSKTLQGALKQRPREERALQVVNATVGEALGKLYVEKKFPAEAKAKAKAMIENVFLAFENRINKLPWMTPETRKGAIDKLRKSTIKIGYPDKWKDYSKLEIVAKEAGGNYFENMKNVAKWAYQEDIEKLNKPVDKTEWGMSPQTVNAYFNPTYNEIVFPAAILQPPFYDYKADEAVNYGGIGAVIGHEISHGFDDSGSRYDADGNLKNWWTDEDLKQFTGLGNALASQYSALQPLPGIFVDGKFTLGENIGDLGGVNAAYDGLQLFLSKKGRPATIDGFTPEQRFFISWATIWRSKMRDEAIKNQVKTDPHSPGMYRAYIPLTNVDAFYQAFNIKEGDKLFVKPENRIKIW
ncbi:endothelin-converting protein [Flavobacterium columnare NBRC 100251 = ATCC 23463]|uniref:M13 family metallopeptidase PepO n=2 Tax=Flavobacterium columnare TaxID=996 RepID=G8X8L8_FLACA|nr:M13 family metallopeptidase [Flavobacterium columnare]AEW86469.2 M13 family metallopeptidase PepO precursor [Flavobacterium columnare ATCC 49512]ANO49651.1 M13 family metallopeptidase PepO precursor [Flavobacterium columnare]PDS27030.1 endothelin-converting protein [Flavobacterium columnare NBRC 100251 = ATCC 23463]GEM57800.1 endothelin-converting protein [Flavobacterium columnare NBRC 100251 = ATCC 23463]